jgi:hypothetical protein
MSTPGLKLWHVILLSIIISSVYFYKTGGIDKVISGLSGFDIDIEKAKKEIQKIYKDL